tara:strand:- start:410 stop:526 length:117 start_codon:yes stop_codon:yes gene_type:complete
LGVSEFANGDVFIETAEEEKEIQVEIFEMLFVYRGNGP